MSTELDRSGAETGKYGRVDRAETDLQGYVQGIDVSVDIEGVLYNILAPFIDYTNEFLDRHHPEYLEQNGRVTEEELGGWGFDGLKPDFIELRGWDEEEAIDKMLWGDEDGWLGFHPVTEYHWCGERAFGGEPGEQLVHPSIENMALRLEDLAHIDYVDNVYIVTGRQNFPGRSLRNVRKAVRERLENDRVLENSDGLYHSSKKPGFEPEGNRLQLFLDDNPKMEFGPGQAQIIIDKESNRQGADIMGEVKQPESIYSVAGDFGHAVEIMENEGDQILEVLSPGRN